MTTTISHAASYETIHHKGDLVIEGNVGQGATIIVTDGSLRVKGEVAKYAEIKTEASTLEHTGKGGITLEQAVGKRVTLEFNGPIELHQDCAGELCAVTQDPASGLKGVFDVNLKKIGPRSTVVGRQVTIEEIGELGIVHAHQKAVILHLGANSNVKMGDDATYHGKTVGPLCMIFNARKISINSHDPSASLGAKIIKVSQAKPKIAGA